LAQNSWLSTERVFASVFELASDAMRALRNTNVEFDINAPVASSNPNLAAEVQEVTQTSTPQIVWKLDFTPAGENAYRAYRVPSLYPGVTWPY
jgi:hypothetical protein